MKGKGYMPKLSNALTASFWISGTKCEYVSKVSVIVECPSLSCTILGFIFWDSRSVAWVWWRSWNVIWSKFSCFNIGIKYLDLKLLVDRIFPKVPEIITP